MKRICSYSVGICLAVALSGCGEPPVEDVARQSSAVTTVGSAVRGYTRSDGQHAIVFNSPSNGHVNEILENPFGLAAPTDLGGVVANSPPWGYKRTDNVDAVMYIDTAGHIHEFARVAGSWIENDFTTLSFIRAPLGQTTANGGVHPEVLAYVRTDGKNTVIYRGADNHIYEIASNFSSSPSWIVSDLTVAAGAPNVGIDGPVPYIRSDGRNTIVYTATDNHIHELTSNFSGSPAWLHYDLYPASNETVAAATGPWPYVRRDNINVVVFIGGDGRIHQLTLNIGTYCGDTPWCSEVILKDMTASTTRPAAYVRADGVNSVIYLRSSPLGTIMDEASLVLGGSWVDNVFWWGYGTPFGHIAPGGRSSVLVNMTNLNTYEVTGYELSALPGAGYDLQAF